MHNPIAFKATSDPDTLYFHQAMSAHDWHNFVDAIVKKINGHAEKNHWELVPLREVPKGTDILDSVWAFKQKCKNKTREVYKHKAWLNIHGGQQEYG